MILLDKKDFLTPHQMSVLECLGVDTSDAKYCIQKVYNKSNNKYEYYVQTIDDNKKNFVCNTYSTTELLFMLIEYLHKDGYGSLSFFKDAPFYCFFYKNDDAKKQDESSLYAEHPIESLYMLLVWCILNNMGYASGIDEKEIPQLSEKDTKPAKWLYRLEFKDETNGLWYNGNGDWCFEKGIGSLSDECKTKTLPMDFDERYKADGRDWFSSCSNKEDLLHWYSKEDANTLMANGFVFTRYLATEYTEYEMETVFIKETCIKREEIEFNSLFKD